MAGSNQWSLKNKQGKLFGPFDSKKIIELIKKGIIEAEEQVSIAGLTQWTTISKRSEFYDYFIEALQNPPPQVSEADKEKELIDHSETKKFEEGVDFIKTKAIPLTQNPDLQNKKRQRGYVIPQKTSRKERAQKISGNKASDGFTIDLKNTIELKSKSLKENAVKILMIVGVFLALAAMFLNNSENVDIREKIHLIFPQKQSSKISHEEEKEKFRISLLQFQKDTFKGYYKAENILVSLLESNSKNADAIALLCLTYRELWEFAQKDSKDYQTLSKVVQLATDLDPVGVNGSTCRAAVALLKNQTENADSLIQGVLRDQPTAAVFYEMEAELIAQQKNYESAIGYLQKTQTLWPEWLKPFVREAQYRKKINDVNNAAKILRNVLAENPDHAEAKIHLGIIELFDFQHPEAATDLILVGLEQDKVSRATTLVGYSALAAYYQRIDKKQKALEYAKKAFVMDPTNVDMRDLIVQLGGQQEFEKIQTQEDEVLALGDQYFKTGNYLAAQAEFKAAYDMNRKNATAALKAAQSLSKIHQSLDAIEWAKKAVIADPKYIEAYYDLSDYFSRRYDFKVAVEYLSQAQRQVPNHYLTFRGFSLLELRRNNSKGAIDNATRALKLYDTDLQTHLILAKALLQSGEFEKAYQNAAKALELDEHNFEAQEVYALTLGGVQGIRSAEEYMRNLVNTYPSVAAYRFSLGKVFYNDERYSDSAQVLEQALQLDPENLEGEILLGKSYKAINDPTKALKAYLQAAGLDPSNVEPLFLIAILYNESEKTAASALQYFERVARINPNYPLANYWIGKMALKLGDFKKAIDYDNREKQKNPNVSDAYTLAGEIYLAQNNFTQATNEFRKAIQLRPQDVSLYIVLARAYRLSGQLDVASSMIKIAATKESGNPEVYKEQGAIFEKRGQLDEAILSYNRYLELKPNAPDKTLIEDRIKSVGGGN